MDNPNILLLMGDQHPAFMTGCYGHDVVKTPTLDRLGNEGVVFNAAYCPSPLCAPSRAAMMTSRHVHTIEVWDNASPLRSDWPTFAHSFSAAGYRTILCGKMHFVGPDQHHGFEERWTQEIYPATFDWTYPSRNGVYVPPEGTGQSRHRVYKSGIGWTPDMDYDEEVLFSTLYGLRRIARQDDRRPFLLCASFTGPHYPYYAPEPYWNLYTDEDIELPHIPEGFKEGEHQYVKWFRQYAHLEEPVPADICRRARHATLGRISMLDDYISRILDTLKTSGLDEETIVLYTSDHGDMMGEHGLWFKCTAYEWSSRVPLIVSGPGIPRHRVEAPVSLLDLGPTLCSMAGIEPVYPVSDGRDVSDLVYGERPDGEGEVIVEYHGDGTWRGWRMIRRGDYKLVHVPGYEPALYDLRQDPDEWNNLASDPRYQEVAEDLKARVLEDWDADLCNEKTWRSQERRIAILNAIEQSRISLDWQAPFLPVPHPLR